MDLVIEHRNPMAVYLLLIGPISCRLNFDYYLDGSP